MNPTHDLAPNARSECSREPLWLPKLLLTGKTMAKIEIKETCKCGAKFAAYGESMSVALRHGAWLDAHAPCRNREEE